MSCETFAPSTVPPSVTIAEPAGIVGCLVLNAAEVRFPAARPATVLEPYGVATVTESGTVLVLSMLTTNWVLPATHRVTAEVCAVSGAGGANVTV